MKPFLAIAAFVALTYADMSRASSIARRISVLRALASDIKRLDGEMSYNRLPLKRLLASAKPLALPSFWQTVLDAHDTGEVGAAGGRGLGQHLVVLVAVEADGRRGHEPGRSGASGHDAGDEVRPVHP